MEQGQIQEALRVTEKLLDRSELHIEQLRSDISSILVTTTSHDKQIAVLEMVIKRISDQQSELAIANRELKAVQHDLTNFKSKLLGGAIVASTIAVSAWELIRSKMGW